MIYLIFTQDGFEQAKQNMIDRKAMLWINRAVLSDEQIVELSSAGIIVNLLEKSVNPANEKSIFTAIDLIEKECPDSELFVEYV